MRRKYFYVNKDSVDRDDGIEFDEQSTFDNTFEVPIGTDEQEA